MKRFFEFVRAATGAAGGVAAFIALVGLKIEPDMLLHIAQSIAKVALPVAGGSQILLWTRGILFDARFYGSRVWDLTKLAVGVLAAWLALMLFLPSALDI